ncbi:MAG: hypothetical protein ABI844_09965, partial [Saprospiraceae bacterium]
LLFSYRRLMVLNVFRLQRARSSAAFHMIEIANSERGSAPKIFVICNSVWYQGAEHRNMRSILRAEDEVQYYGALHL